MATTRKKKIQRVALVTGAAVGIGKAIAQQLAQDGFRVVVSDRDFKAATKTARAIEATGGSQWACPRGAVGTLVQSGQDYLRVRTITAAAVYLGA